MKRRAHPHLLEVNAFVAAREFSQSKPALSQMDSELTLYLAQKGFDLVWLMGVWQRSSQARQCALNINSLRKEYDKSLPGWSSEDVSGSPYAVFSYQIDSSLGSESDLLKLRSSLNRKNIGLILDFVPNHLAMDHPWTKSHPEYFVNATDEENAKNPGLFFKTESGFLAHGRDPYFLPWQDTVQFNFFSREARQAAIQELLKIASLCDGVRCDMAMLGLNEVFQKTWGLFLKNTPMPQTEYWTEVIDVVRKKYPNFIFMAESYWNLEWKLQQLGFDYTYDKKLYDLLLKENVSDIRGHLSANPDYRNKSIRFIENHDEERALTAFGREKSYAAAAVCMTNPGLRFLFEGQMKGRKIHLPVQLSREPLEIDNPDTEEFYNLLLLYANHDTLHEGTWQLLPAISAWGNNMSFQNLLSWAWVYKKEVRLVIINYSSEWSQGRVLIPKTWLSKSCLLFRDWYSLDLYERQSTELEKKGLYVDLGPWSMHLFEVRI